NNIIFLLDLTAVGTVILVAIFFSSNINVEFFWLTAASLALLFFTAVTLIALIRYVDAVTWLIQRLPVPKSRLTRQRKKAFFWWCRLQHSLKASANVAPKKIAALYLITLSSWAIRFLILFIVLIALGADIDWPITALIQFISGLAGMISFLPGGF